MDELLFQWFNGWYDNEGPLFTAIFFLHTDTVKFLPFMLAFWSLWFWKTEGEERLLMREKLVTMVVVSFIAIAVARILGVLLPYSARPINTEGLEIVGLDRIPANFMQELSSLPSDHAAFAMSMGIGIFLIHRWVGVGALLWGIFIASILRIVMARHWPSDILAGWLVGAVITLVLFKLVQVIVTKTRIVPFFEDRAYLGYPLLFFVTYEMALLFKTTRRAIEILLT